MNLFKSKNNILIFLIIILAIILRFVWLDKIPPSLYSDEAGQGYNAYSILKTGKDEHGVFLPVSLRSFGDWKPPLPSYLMIPAIAIFGLNEFSVRLPSAIFGVGSVMITFFLIREIFRSLVYKTKLALLTSFFLAISPWHILQSRSAMLVIISLLLLEAGVYLYFMWHRHKYLLPLSIILFALSIYSYYGMRMITPLMILILMIQDYKNIRLNLGWYFISLFLGIVILLPLFISFIHQPDVVFGRARTVSVFYDQGVKLRQWELITQDGMNFPVNLARFFHNSVYLYGKNILERYFSHFDLNYLFIKGDNANPFKIPGMGILYFSDIIFFIFLLLYFFNNKTYYKNIILWWLLLSILPAAFTFVTPSSNRSFNAVFPLIMLISIGMTRFLYKYKYKLLVTVMITVFYILNMSYFMNKYYLSISYKYPEWWGYRWKKVARYINQNESKYENIIFLNENNMAYIYLLFYNQYDPILFQKEVVRNYVSDTAGFEHIDSYGKYIFYNDLKWENVNKSLLPNSLYVIPFNKIYSDQNMIGSIKYPNGDIALQLYSTVQ